MGIRKEISQFTTKTPPVKADWVPHAILELHHCEIPPRNSMMYQRKMEENVHSWNICSENDTYISYIICLYINILIFINISS